MFGSISFSAQIFILSITPLLFISDSILCEFAMLPDVYILLSPPEEEVHSSFWGNRCTGGSTSIKKIKTFAILLLCLGNTQKNKTAEQTALSLVL